MAKKEPYTRLTRSSNAQDEILLFASWSCQRRRGTSRCWGCKVFGRGRGKGSAILYDFWRPLNFLFGLTFSIKRAVKRRDCFTVGDMQVYFLFQRKKDLSDLLLGWDVLGRETEDCHQCTKLTNWQAINLKSSLLINSPMTIKTDFILSIYLFSSLWQVEISTFKPKLCGSCIMMLSCMSWT